MFGKMKKMLKDEEGTGILGAIAGAIVGCLPGGSCAAICAPCISCCPWCCLPCPATAATLGGALCGALGGVGGVLFDRVTIGVACIGTTMSACFGSVAACIDCIPSLMGGK